MSDDTTKIRERPLFAALAGDVENILIPELRAEGWRDDAENPMLQRYEGKHLIWFLFKIPNPELVASIGVYVSLPFEPVVRIEASVWRVEKSGTCGADALHTVHALSGRRMRDRGSAFVGSLTLFESYVSPYRSFKDFGSAPLRLFMAIKPRTRLTALPLFVLLDSLSVITFAVSYPIALVAQISERRWLNAAPNRTAAARRRVIDRAVAEVSKFGPRVERYLKGKTTDQ